MNDTADKGHHSADTNSVTLHIDPESFLLVSIEGDGTELWGWEHKEIIGTFFAPVTNTYWQRKQVLKSVMWMVHLGEVDAMEGRMTVLNRAGDRLKINARAEFVSDAGKVTDIAFSARWS